MARELTKTYEEIQRGTLAELVAWAEEGEVLGEVVIVVAGAEPVTAAVWGVYLHGEAGNALAERTGPVGFMARELPAQVPAIMHRVSRDGGEG